MLTEEDFPDPETPLISKLVFIAMAQLLVILDEALQRFYTLRAQREIRTISVEALLELVMSFEIQLDNFERDMLKRVKSARANQSMLDPSGTVELAYLTIKIVVYRAMLRSLPPSASYQIRQSARAAIVATVDMLDGLQGSRLRSFWWSHTSRTDFALLGSLMFSMCIMPKVFPSRAR